MLILQRGRKLVLDFLARTSDELFSDTAALAIADLITESQECNPSAGMLLENRTFILTAFAHEFFISP
jgi:hypothetical protein